MHAQSVASGFWGWSSQTWDTLGLSMDILGVCILFRFALPDAVNRFIGHSIFDELTSQEREEFALQLTPKDKRWRIQSKIGHWSGVILIVLGFVLQIVASW